MRIPLMITLLLFLFVNLKTQDISFYKENITLRIDNDYLYVSGIYYLKSDSIINTTIFYPYPVDLLYGEVDSIYIYNLTASKLIEPLESNDKRSVFKISFDQNKEIIIQASYRQKLLGLKAEYILKTTIGWGESLRQANYQLIVPANIKVYEFSLQPQDSIITKSEVVYYWTKYNYLPSENLIILFDLK